MPKVAAADVKSYGKAGEYCVEKEQNDSLITDWLAVSQAQWNIASELEKALLEQHRLSLNEFYVLLFLCQAPQKKLKLQQLESMVGLSQSAMSRLVSRFEAKGCGALKRHICEEDRRAVYTSLTEIGEEEVTDALATFREVLEREMKKTSYAARLRSFLESGRQDG